MNPDWKHFGQRHHYLLMVTSYGQLYPFITPTPYRHPLPQLQPMRYYYVWSILMVHLTIRLGAWAPNIEMCLFSSRTLTAFNFFFVCFMLMLE